MAEICCIDIKHIIHFSSKKCNQTIISEQINANFLLLSVFILIISIWLKQDKKTSINLLKILNTLFDYSLSRNQYEYN